MNSGNLAHGAGSLGQSAHVVSGFVKAGIVINGIEEHALRDHRPQTAALWRLMLFVVTKENARARIRARVKITAIRRLWTLTRPRRNIAADNTKSTSEGKPQNINELRATGSGPRQALAQEVSALTVSGRDPEEQVYVWMLGQTHIQGLMLSDSGAAV